MAVDDRDGADSGVADDCEVADAFDRTRIGERRDVTDDRERSKIDDREPCFGVTRDERTGHRRSERVPQRHRRSRSQQDELSTVHDSTTPW